MDQRSTMVSTTTGAVAVRSAGEGPPVLLVHGIPGSSGVWAAVSDGLVDAGFRVLAPDLLGFADSDRPMALDDLWIGAQVTALAEVLDAVDALQAIVVGHDYGAPISVMLASRRPRSVSGLVLAAGNLFTDTPIPVPLNTVTWPLIGGPVGRLAFSGLALQMMLRAGVGRPRVRLDRAVHLGDAAQRRAIGTIFAGALRELHVRYAEVEAALADLRTPTVVLWGDRDPFFGIEQADRTVDAVPDAVLQVEAGAGHFLPAERPEAFVDAVQQLAG